MYLLQCASGRLVRLYNRHGGIKFDTPLPCPSLPRFLKMSSAESPVALITGGSAGLGLVIAKSFLSENYRVMIVGRDQKRLDQALTQLGANDTVACAVCVDVSQPSGVRQMIAATNTAFGRLDALVNCVGKSDRGLIETLDSEHLMDLFRQNVTTALLCSQAAIPMLEKTGGTIVNIGSLGGKVGARYIGGYATAKHAVTGMSQQLRLELKPKGIHVGLVSPGPIRRGDAGERYKEQITSDLPDQARKPGGGTKVKGLPPEKVAAAVLMCVQKRNPDIVLPGYLRILITIGNAFPRIGDWLLLKLTS